MPELRASEFHTHVDTEFASPEIQAGLANLAFEPDDFLHIGKVRSYEPKAHFTFKTTKASEFKNKIDAAKNYLAIDATFKGYLEAEAIVSHRVLDGRGFDPTVKVPLKASLVKLPPGNFREDELHIYFPQASMDERLRENMELMGFYPAYCNEVYDGQPGIEEIWTMQGFNHNIPGIVLAIGAYLEKAGGFGHCIIQEERVVDYWISGYDVPLPPVVKEVVWL